ncbi:uncharacterized protein LOC143194114 [Rhynchophorus ferrugineus]|uniref:uncharacterized protein LOC143194114 n=1 Tax=Rhynchophorus ferrugineus TaxID=354439 RepID=UPI003FCCA630
MIENRNKCVPLFGPNVEIMKGFGILPNYNFSLNRLGSRICSLFYVVILITFMISMEVYIWMNKFYTEYSESYLSIIVRVMCELSGYIMFNSVVIWSYTRRKLWERLFQQISNVCSQQIVKEHQDIKRTILRNANLYFVVATFIILLLYVLDILFWQIENSSVSFVLSYIYFYYSFLLSNLIGQIALELSNQYRYMRYALTACSYTNIESVTKMVRQTKRLYLEMHKVIDTFNKLFGELLLLMAIQCSLQILDFGIFLIEKVLPNLKFQYDTFFLYVIFIILNLIWFSMTQFRCDMTKRQSLQLLSICYNLIDGQLLSSEVHQELQIFIGQMKSRPVCFSAAGFFEIKRSTTFSIVGTTATYFIVFVELRNNDTSITINNRTL